MSADEDKSPAKIKKVEEMKSSTNRKTKVKLLAIGGDIDDFLEENPIYDISESMNDLDWVIKRMEDLRSSYRATLLEIEVGDETLEDDKREDYDSRILSIKTYVLQAKEARRKLRKKDEDDNGDSKGKDMHQLRDEVMVFLLDEMHRIMSEVEEECEVDLPSVDKKMMIQRNKEVGNIEKKMHMIAEKIPEFIAYCSPDEDPKVIISVKKRYQDLTTTCKDYISKVKEEVKKRELEKEDVFNPGFLNIKLEKFKGYGSTMDLYTFKGDFEKLFAEEYPKRLLSDLLKNNYLEGTALNLVRHVEDIEEIWERLKKAFGDPKIMLGRKIEELNNIGSIWRTKGQEKTIDSLHRIINLMRDLMKLSSQHDIENDLYYGDGLDKIFKLIGDGRATRWIAETYNQKLSNKESWESLLKFLEKESNVLQQKVKILGKDSRQDVYKDGFKDGKRDGGRRTDNYHTGQHDDNQDKQDGNLVCSICGKNDHVSTMGPNRTKVIQYFTCKQFVDMHPGERFNTVKSKGFCWQCLLPGANVKDGKHSEGRCQRDFVCRNPIHHKFKIKKHVLLCEEHKDSEENKKLLEEYKSRCIHKEKEIGLPNFSKEIKLVFHTDGCAEKGIYPATKPVDVKEKALYQLQVINVGGKNYSLFFDSGCGDFVSRHKAIKRIGSRARQEVKGPLQLGGVGGLVTESRHGIYTVKLPLHNGESAEFSGVCLDGITREFPMYPVKGIVEDEIHEAYRRNGKNPDNLPKLPDMVGGQIDFMIGIKYLRYHPEKIFQMPSGLTIYKSMFRNADGGRGIIGGPHEVFTAIENQFYLKSDHQLTFLCNQEKLFRMGYQINPDVSLLGFQEEKLCTERSMKEEDEDITPNSYMVASVNRFEDAEKSGSEISYRCMKCRTCKDCKKCDVIEPVSIREEIEEDLISKSIEVDLAARTCTAKLPFIYDPVSRLAPNKEKALKVYYQQLKRLSNDPTDKNDVLKSEKKLHELGFVQYVRDLPEHLQQELSTSKIQNFIPWRVVWKENSLSTPCRVVFDASQPTASGYSLNDILAKGKNNLNKLQEILIRWCTHMVGFHSDVQKMYNCVRLDSKDWCLQRYIWQEDLNPNKIPKEKVIKTLIYGVKSSGNLAERCIRQTANESIKDYPEITEIVNKDFYVDDCLSGERSKEMAYKRADQMEVVLNRGGFSLKAISFSGKKPPEELSDDGESIVVAGIKWFTEEDKISLNLGEMIFAKKKRGRKPKDVLINVVPEKLTRRDCVAKVAEVYDLLGKFTPIIAEMKMDLHDLVRRQLHWDDLIPDSLRPIWLNHFEMISEVKNIKFKRALVPSDAAELACDTLDFGDASRSMLCVAIYIRFRRLCGQYSCQMIFARSRLIPDNMSQPRAELYAAVVNAHSGEVVRRALCKHHQKSLKLTDSQIVLHWLTNDTKPLKQWVRNRVLEVQRFSKKEQWMYIDSKNMMADIGTRKGSKIEDVNQESLWINGFDWMKEESIKFPVKSADEIILAQSEMKEIKKECAFEIQKEVVFFNETSIGKVPTQVLDRYVFSNYLVDPNRRSFKQVVRIVAIVFRFINLVRRKINCNNGRRNEESDGRIRMILDDAELKAAENYFFRKATLEVKQFYRPGYYQKFAKEVDGILRYSGRILPGSKVDVAGGFTDVMKDLSTTMFCVPVIDKHSPIAYSIAMNYHWTDSNVKHCGIETTLREMLKYVYIIEGRDLVKKIKKTCERCRYLEKKTIEVSMGPISSHNITIAPAFFVSQVDLAGPLKSYSNINKRASLKIWVSLFCCSTTSTISIKVMESYSTPSFIQAFIRFSCEMGYPKLLQIDSGSQLLTGCANMKLNFQDLKFKLHRDVDVDAEIVPVGGHNMNGRVERKIREVKKSIDKNAQNERLSIIQWETLFSEIANRINDLPIALGNITSDFESMDLLTPNRLRLGRNNQRSPSGTLTIVNNPMKLMEENERIFNRWFEQWLVTHVPKLIVQPKWFKIEHHLKKGDVVLFLKHDSVLSSTYQYGIVTDTEKSQDDVVRKARVKYRNHNEKTDRETYRSVRSLIMIHPFDELSLHQELATLNEIAERKIGKYDTKME